MNRKILILITVIFAVGIFSGFGYWILSESRKSAALEATDAKDSFNEIQEIRQGELVQAQGAVLDTEAVEGAVSDSSQSIPRATPPASVAGHGSVPENVATVQEPVGSFVRSLPRSLSTGKSGASTEGYVVPVRGNTGNPLGQVEADLPLALYQTPANLNLSPAQEARVEQLAADFVKKTGADQPNQVANDPHFSEEWQKQQQISDQLLRSAIGWQAYNKLKDQVYYSSQH